MTTQHEEDPRLTAYALGELPESEIAEMEALLAENPQAMDAVRDIREFGLRLEDELRRDIEPGLTAGQKRKVIGEAEPGRWWPAFRWSPLLSSAAVLMAVCMLGGLLLPATMRSRERAGINVRLAERPVAPVNTVAEEMPGNERRPRGEVVECLPEPDPSGQGRPVPAKPGQRIFAGAPSVLPPCCPSTKSRAYYANRRADYSDMDDSGVVAESYDEDRRYGPSIEHYDGVVENDFMRVADHPLSTFSIDVDTASYSNVRRFLAQGRLPPKSAVRIEELINYFNYDYGPPNGDVPFATHLEVASCPWNTEHRLVRVGLKGKVIEAAERPVCNLVFLLDVSGSMQDGNKLPLVKRAMSVLVRNLNRRDRVSIAVYAGAAGLVLPPTTCDESAPILEALDKLSAGGSTAGGAGIKLAYETAKEHCNPDGINRVILCTDGDFNVGVTQTDELVDLVAEQAKAGIFLTVLGFGMGNYKDSMLEKLADKGNGNYGYIDTFSEARKMLVDQLTGTLVTIAKDVKIQVEFNPDHVAEYRLVGYENRMLKKEDFNDDKKDAGEIGAGHTVTALYELVPKGKSSGEKPRVDPLKYQRSPASAGSVSGEIMTLKLRYKLPDSDKSSKIEFALKDDGKSFDRTPDDFRFAAAVATFGMLLRDSQHKGSASYDQVLEIAADSVGKDSHGYRREFLALVRNAKALAGPVEVPSEPAVDMRRLDEETNP